MKQIKDLFFSRKNRKKAAIFCLLFLLGLIFFFGAEYSLSEKRDESVSVLDESGFEAQTETRLKALLEEMDGVSDVHVMVTLERSEEKCVQTEPASFSSDGILASALGDSGEKSTVLAVSAPRIRGVSIVCRGAADAETRYKIIRLVSSALNLKSNRIFVSE